MNNRKARRAWNAALRKHTRPGRVLLLTYKHDNDCLIYGPARVCCCSPHRILMDDQHKVLATVRGLGPYDPLELAWGVA